ncbi:MAG TPA: PilN domain-containing protein [Burkholderiales bacterium]|nr:PilN domain-containing protein [Burkholderiales bacterium]
MNDLQIDFRRPRASWPWAGRVLLALAVAFSGDVAVSYVKAVRATRAKQGELARLEPHRARGAKSATPEEIAAARETVQRLSTPWGRLFSALETAATDNVTLLSIEPDPKARTVLISGDSKDYLAALTYVLNLSRAGTLANVQLVRHEVKKDEPQRPVGFAISAAWQEEK